MSETSRQVAVARTQFLTTGVAGAVRDEVVSAWQRCSMLAVPPEGAQPQYHPEFNNDSAFVRAALPVLEQVSDRLDNLDIAFILVDPDAQIVARHLQHHGLERRLDNVSAAEGFVFTEDTVGNNGLATPIELRRTTRIDGHEHYAEEFKEFTCVGVPVKDPMLGKIVGVLDVSCAADPGNGYITLIAEQTARHIEERLFEQRTRREHVLFDHFLQARRGGVGSMVVSDRLLLTDPIAARLLDSVEQTVVWEHAARALHRTAVLDDHLLLPDGRGVAIRARAISDAGEPIGVLMEIVSAGEGGHHRSLGAAPSDVPPLAEAGPRAAASGYRQAQADVRAALRHDVVLISGEAGVGKSTLAGEVHHLDEVTGALLVRDLADLHPDARWTWMQDRLTEIEGEPGTLVLTHAHLIDDALSETVVAVARLAQTKGWRCVVTTTDISGWSGVVLPTLEPVRVSLPALRDRVDDIPRIVRELAHPRHVASEVVQLLMRLPWLGNIPELQSVVRQMLAAAPSGIVGLDAVPVQIRQLAPRPSLSRYERAELHTLLTAVAECGGNKKETAKLLGISRSTLYRKLRAAGVDLRNSTY